MELMKGKKVKYNDLYADVIEDIGEKIKISYYCKKGKQKKTVLKTDVIIIGHGN